MQTRADASEAQLARQADGASPEGRACRMHVECALWLCRHAGSSAAVGSSVHAYLDGVGSGARGGGVRW